MDGQPAKLTFADLRDAVQRSAGLGQVDISTLPLSSAELPGTPQYTTAQDVLTAPVAAAVQAAAGPTSNWLLLGAVAVGLILFGSFVGGARR